MDNVNFSVPMAVQPRPTRVVIVNPDGPLQLGIGPQGPRPLPPSGMNSRQAASRLQQALAINPSSVPAATTRGYAIGAGGSAIGSIALTGLSAFNMVTALEHNGSAPAGQTIGISALGSLVGVAAVASGAAALYTGVRLHQAVTQNRIAEAVRTNPQAIVQLPVEQRQGYLQGILSAGRAFLAESESMVARIAQNPELVHAGVTPGTGHALIQQIRQEMTHVEAALSGVPGALQALTGGLPSLHTSISQFIAYAAHADETDAAGRFTVVEIGRPESSPPVNQHIEMQHRGHEAV